MLLYGTNAVGKTSLIRALGVAVIMAQSSDSMSLHRRSYIAHTAPL